MNWVPPTATTEQEKERFRKIREGIPKSCLPEISSFLNNLGNLYSRLERFQTIVDVDLGLQKFSGDFRIETDDLARMGNDVLVDLLDYLIAIYEYSRKDSSGAKVLDEILEASRSEWAVGNRDGRCGLVKRAKQAPS